MYDIEFLINPALVFSRGVGLVTRHASREASGVPRPVKVERHRQRQKSSPPRGGLLRLGTLNGWGARYPEKKARSAGHGFCRSDREYLRRFGLRILHGFLSGKSVRERFFSASCGCSARQLQRELASSPSPYITSSAATTISTSATIAGGSRAVFRKLKQNLEIACKAAGQ